MQNFNLNLIQNYYTMDDGMNLMMLLFKTKKTRIFKQVGKHAS